ncbi:hypothetical protein MtrunA17_Chr4g0009421 [Medicago truncatula]|uniref:Transmembrane protein n=1 Tax=Medicago truncatula TaxID=3880 RepID=A0A396I2N0_MEDTR|nr:hypothetical protein MtrunA17_Chr4g0009421 [Medicago truncatula]
MHHPLPHTNHHSDIQPPNTYVDILFLAFSLLFIISISITLQPYQLCIHSFLY